jgi:transposase-like protein
MKPHYPQMPESDYVEYVKGLDMVDFLSRHYGLDFSGPGGGGGGHHCCLSPFNGERRGSFFVREVNGHWLFKDFSSGYGGSLIDFVLLKEGFCGVSETLRYIGYLLSGEKAGDVGGVSGFVHPPPRSSPSSSSSSRSSDNDKDHGYDIKSLYHKFQRNDIGQCRAYLSSRGICEEVINHLCERGLVVHNILEGKSYCCFAVFNDAGQLRCLDNHQVDGEGKFILGSKHPFSLDWSELPISERVFVTESIIDYLSIKTLEGFSFRGLALLGNVINFSSSHFASSIEIVSALDGDNGGFRAFLDLEESFSDRVVRVYDFGDSKDANEYLQNQQKRKEGRRLSAQDKLLLYQDYHKSENKSEVARHWGINRSHMYEIVSECEELILSGFSQRRPGRKPADQPDTLAEARERLAVLEEENRRLDEERERYWVRNEFMKIRLKWAEHEASELRGEVDSPSGNQSSSSPASKNRKKHLKKKRRKKS